MRTIRWIAGAAVVAIAALQGAAQAQLQPAAPMTSAHPSMPTPGTATPPVRMEKPAPVPTLPHPPPSPESPVTQEVIPPARYPGMPKPATVAPPTIMATPGQLPPSQVPPGVRRDTTTPTIPVPSGTALGPPVP